METKNLAPESKVVHFSMRTLVHFYLTTDTCAENGTAYLIMEYLEGETLQSRLSRGPLSASETVGLALTLANSLSVVHRAGVVHRDIKPDNLFLTSDGRVVLIDFGAAREFLGAKRTHTMIFTPAFAAPEQFVPNGGIGPHTDLYSLGVTLLYSLTSKVPTPAWERLNGGSDPVITSDIPQNLRLALQAMLVIDPQRRLQSAHDLQTILSAQISPGASFPTGHEGPVTSVVYLSDGKHLITGSRDGRLLVWDSKDKVPVQELGRHRAPVSGLAFSIVKNLVASVSEDGALKVWDLQSGNQTAEILSTTGAAHSVAFAPYGKQLAVGTDQALLIIDPQSGWTISRIEGKGFISAFFALEGQMLFVGTDRGEVQGYFTRDWTRVWNARGGLIFGKPNPPLAISRDYMTLATACSSRSGRVMLWGIGTRNLQIELSGHRRDITCLAFHPRMPILVSGSQDGTVRIWDYVMGKYKSDLAARGIPSALAFSWDGTTLAVGDNKGGLQFYSGFQQS